MSILEAAATLAKHGDLAGAIELLDNAELEGPDRVNAFGMKGSMLSELGDYLGAARASGRTCSRRSGFRSAGPPCSTSTG